MVVFIISCIRVKMNQILISRTIEWWICNVSSIRGLLMGWKDVHCLYKKKDFCHFYFQTLWNYYEVIWKSALLFFWQCTPILKIVRRLRSYQNLEMMHPTNLFTQAPLRLFIRSFAKANFQNSGPGKQSHMQNPLVVT